MLVIKVQLEIVLEFVKFFGGAIGIVSHVIQDKVIISEAYWILILTYLNWNEHLLSLLNLMHKQLFSQLYLFNHQQQHIITIKTFQVNNKLDLIDLFIVQKLVLFCKQEFVVIYVLVDVSVLVLHYEEVVCFIFVQHGLNGTQILDKFVWIDFFHLKFSISASEINSLLLAYESLIGNMTINSLTKIFITLYQTSFIVNFHNHFKHHFCISVQQIIEHVLMTWQNPLFNQS